MSADKPPPPAPRPDDPEVLRRAFKRLAAEVEPPPAGWQRKVLDGARRAPRGARRWRLVLLLAPAAVVLGVVLLIGRPPPASRSGEALSLRVEVRGGEGGLRGGAAQVGDELVLRVGVVPGRDVLLRLYRDDVLRSSCAADCPRVQDEVQLRVRIDERGRYRAVAASASAVVPPLGGAFEADLAVLLLGGAEVDAPPGTDVH
jgi:hypothetical protein